MTLTQGRELARTNAGLCPPLTPTSKTRPVNYTELTHPIFMDEALGMDSQPSDWLPDSFYRSPAWRVLRASHLLKTGHPAEETLDDAWVEVAKELLTSVEEHHVSRVPAAVRTAYEVWAADQMPRWLLEAQLLTPRTFGEIAAECSLSEVAVHAFHELFFDVRSRLQARDWIMSLAVRSHPLNDFAGPQPGGLWKFFGFVGGEKVLDVVVAVTLNRPLPDWLRPHLAANPDVEEQRLRLKTKLAVALLTAKNVYQLGPVVELVEQLRLLDKQAGLLAKEADPLLPAFSEFFALLSRTQRTASDAVNRTPAQDGRTRASTTQTHPTATQQQRQS